MSKKKNNQHTVSNTKTLQLIKLLQEMGVRCTVETRTTNNGNKSLPYYVVTLLDYLDEMDYPTELYIYNDTFIRDYGFLSWI